MEVALEDVAMRQTSFCIHLLSCLTFLGIVSLAYPAQGQWGYSPGNNPGLNRAIYPPSQVFPRNNPVPYTTNRYNPDYPYGSNYHNGYGLPHRDGLGNNVEIRCHQCQINYLRDRPSYPERGSNYPYYSRPYQRW